MKLSRARLFEHIKFINFAISPLVGTIIGGIVLEIFVILKKKCWGDTGGASLKNYRAWRRIAV